MISSWPRDLLFDELWLKSRRVLREALESRRMWPGDEDYRRGRRRQELRGQSLRNQLLQPALGPADYGTLLSPRVFGHGGDVFRSSLPIAFAFGHEVTTALHQAREGSPGAVERCAAAGALFNVFCSLFDHLHDSGRAGAAALKALVTPGLLAELAQNPSGAGFDEIADAEARVVMKLLAAFYAEAVEAARGGDLSRLVGAVGRAYDAELNSLAADGPADPESALERGIGPFLVMSGCAALGSSHPAAADADRLAVDLGTAFTILDDIVDLVSDLRQGASNSLIAEFAAVGEPAEIAGALLDSGALAVAVGKVCDHLGRAADGLGRTGRLPSGATASDSLLVFVRDWCG
jgi:hypothetical protein